MVVGNEKVLGLNAEDKGAVFEFPVGALKLNGFCTLLGSDCPKFGTEVEAKVDVLLKEGVEVNPLVAVFPAGFTVVVVPVGALEKKFGRVLFTVFQ